MKLSGVAFWLIASSMDSLLWRLQYDAVLIVLQYNFASLHFGVHIKPVLMVVEANLTVKYERAILPDQISWRIRVLRRDQRNIYFWRPRISRIMPCATLHIIDKTFMSMMTSCFLPKVDRWCPIKQSSLLTRQKL